MRVSAEHQIPPETAEHVFAVGVVRQQHHRILRMQLGESPGVDLARPHIADANQREARVPHLNACRAIVYQFDRALFENAPYKTSIRISPSLERPQTAIVI